MRTPSACTLPSEERPLRLAEFQSLVGDHWSRTDWLDDRTAVLWLRGGEALAVSVRDLARRESHCCSFFDFAVDGPVDGEVSLRVKVSRRHRRALRAFVDAAARVVQ